MGYSPSDVRIDPAWNSFRNSRLGRAIYRTLRTMFHTKCAFCERVNAKTADHFYPKKRYPKRMFRWSNLLLCCGDCNLSKGAFFPFRNRRPVLLDPTRDDPLEYFVWDLMTGAMAAVVDPVRGDRAQETCDRLKLNDGLLPDERRVALNDILYLLSKVVREYPAITPETRQRLAEKLHPDRQYLGIIRFLFRTRNAYRRLVTDARAKLPEIDVWTAVWL